MDRAVRGLTSRSWRPGRWRELMLGTVPEQLRDLEDVWKSWKPDVVVCDIAMWGPILVMHELKGLPVALLSHVASCILPGAREPAAGNELAAARRAPAETGAGHRLDCARGIGRNSARREQVAPSMGLVPLAGTVTEFTGTLPLYLIPSTPEFDGNRGDLPPSVHYVGPCLWDKDRDEAPPEWIGKVPRDRPCVVVAEGSIYPEKPRLLWMAARALANQPLSAVLIAGQGRNVESLNLGSLASNVRLETWTPLSDVLPIADVLVAGGDSETVMASLERMVPMVLVPMILDQPQVSWRVSRAGAGLRIASWRCSPQRLRAAVAKVLAEQQFRDNAARIHDGFREYSGTDLAAQLLENLLS